MPDVTPKTESAARDELIEWNRRNLHAEEPYFTDLIDRACSEAASAAVAEVLDRLSEVALNATGRKIIREFIASERKP